MLKLDKVQYTEIEKYATSIEFPLIHAVIKKEQKGEIYTSPYEAEKKIWIVHNAGFSYYLTPDRNEKDEDFINFINTSSNLPSYFHFYDPPPFLVRDVSLFTHFNHRIRNRIKLQISQNSLSEAIEMTLPGHMEIKEVDAMNYNKLSVFNFFENKFYESRQDFLQNGLGVCIFDENGNALSLCYSACIVNGMAEIDIITHPDYRSMGLGKIIAYAFVKRAFEKGIISSWDCFEENRASLKTALRIGFSISKEYKFLSVYKQ